MSVINKRIADIFDEIADLLEIEADNPFRIRAYRNGARFLRGLGRDVSEMIESSDNLTRLPNIGRDLDSRIREIISTGRCETLEKVHGQIPATLRELLRVPGLGARRAQNLFLELKITSLDELRQAAGQKKDTRAAGFRTRNGRLDLGRVVETCSSLKRPGNLSFRMTTMNRNMSKEKAAHCCPSADKYK